MLFCTFGNHYIDYIPDGTYVSYSGYSAPLHIPKVVCTYHQVPNLPPRKALVPVEVYTPSGIRGTLTNTTEEVVVFLQQHILNDDINGVVEHLHRQEKFPHILLFTNDRKELISIDEYMKGRC